MNNLQKFCIYTPLRVAGISIVLSYLLSALILYLSRMDRDSQPQHGCDMSAMMYGLVIFFNIFLSLLSYTVALNLDKTIRNNFWLSFFSFFVFEVIYILSSIYGLLSGSFIVPFLYSFPFLIPQIYYFVRFRMRLKQGTIMDGFYCDTVTEEAE